MNDLNSKNSFRRVLIYALKSSFKNIKIYLFMFILPIFIYLFSYLYLTSFDKKEINPAIMLSKLTLPSIFSIFMITTIITDWDNSILKKFLNAFKLNILKYTLALIFLFLIINTIFTFLFIFATMFIDLFVVNKNMLYALNIKNYAKIIQENVISPIVQTRRISGIMVALMFSFMINFIIGFSISKIFKKQFIAQICNILMLLIILLFSDLILDPNSSLFTGISKYFGYLIPQKYITWSIYIAYIDVKSNPIYINLVIINLFIDLFIIHYWISTVLNTILIFIFLLSQTYYVYASRRTQ